MTFEVTAELFIDATDATEVMAYSDNWAVINKQIKQYNYLLTKHNKPG